MTTPTTLAFAAVLLSLASGCTAAVFNVQDDDPSGDDAQSESGADDAGVTPNLLGRAPHLGQATAAPPPDAAVPTDTRPTTVDTGVGVDTSAGADGGACHHACLIASSSGTNLPLGSPLCTWDGECCSGSCYVVHPGTGERGTCVAPGGAALWCGGTQEWCPEAVTKGIARCVS